jgi:hypothetical protein
MYQEKANRNEPNIKKACLSILLGCLVWGALLTPLSTHWYKIETNLFHPINILFSIFIFLFISFATYFGLYYFTLFPPMGRERNMFYYPLIAAK